MNELMSQTVLSVFSLLAILNPFGNLPMFISMSDDLHENQRKKLFTSIVLVAAIIVVIFALVGTFIMENFFQVGLPELRIAGGLILIVIGIKNLLMPQEQKNHDISTYNISDDDAIKVRIIPMAFPLLVGPGTLSTVIILENEYGLNVALIASAITFILIFLLFRLAKYIELLFGKLVLFVLSRIMQVFISAIGVSMLVQGIKQVFGI